MTKIDEFLNHTRYLMEIFFDNRFDEAIEEAREYADESMFHTLMLTSVSMMEMILSMSKSQMKSVLEEIKTAQTKIESRRYVRGYCNYIISPNYSQFTDEQCFAELCYAFTCLTVGAMIILCDDSFTGKFKINKYFLKILIKFSRSIKCRFSSKSSLSNFTRMSRNFKFSKKVGI